MKRIMVCWMLFAGTLCAQEMQSIKKVLDATEDIEFSTFCEFIGVPVEQRAEFAAHYETQSKKIKRVRSSATRQARTQELRDKGRSALQVEEPQLYAEFKACEEGVSICMSPRACVAQNARLFLTRYGAWHEFKKMHAQSQISMWAKVKDFARNGKQRIAHLFGAQEEVKVALNESAEGKKS
ncbi:MAG: hypothetical protein AB7F19_07140 [Candidatus Babeliales bacterium]